MNFLIIFNIITYFTISYGIDLPPGLRPAKAVGESEKPIIPSGNGASKISTESNDKNAPASSSNVQKAPAPVIFQKSNRKNQKKNESQPTVPKHDVPRIKITPPKGKNYGVNTLLQTNLVDSKGRIIKGVNSVPIRVPSSAELKNAKTSRVSVSQVDTDAEKIAPIQFGRAERTKRYQKPIKMNL